MTYPQRRAEAIRTIGVLKEMNIDNAKQTAPGRSLISRLDASARTSRNELRIEKLRKAYNL